MNSTNLPESTVIVFLYDGSVVSASNALPVGRQAAGSLQVGIVTPGNGYDMTMSINLQGMGNEIQTFHLTAET